MTYGDISKYRKFIGNLAWVSTGTSPISSFQSRISLQGNERQVLRLQLSTEKFKYARNELLERIKYVPLDFGTIHFIVYSDGSFQNFYRKHSQVGYVILLSDFGDNFNLFYCPNSLKLNYRRTWKNPNSLHWPTSTIHPILSKHRLLTCLKRDSHRISHLNL